MNAYGQGLEKHSFFKAHILLEGVAVLSRKDNVLGKTSAELAGRAQKKKLPAGVWPAGQALVTGPADDRRVESHPVAWLDSIDRAPDRLDHARALVADGERILDDLVADPPSRIVVDVRAAQSGRRDADKDIRLFFKRRPGDLTNFHAPYSREDDGLHFTRILRGSNFPLIQTSSDS